MKPEIKQQWVAALRDPNRYQQHFESLAYSSSRLGPLQACCLGVLTDLYIQEHEEAWEEVSGGYLMHGESMCKLSERVQTWAGLNTEDPIVANPQPELSVTCTLSYANDVLKCSFEEIASIIEENL
jgi:hypothetical protein